MLRSLHTACVRGVWRSVPTALTLKILVDSRFDIASSGFFTGGDNVGTASTNCIVFTLD
jgi:hypothetical protein